MPRPVVPIAFSPRRASRARSSRPCDGRIRAALSASFRFCGEMSSPFPRIVSISSSKAQGSTTTPLPMIDNGVVVDPWALLDEIDTMRGKGLDISPQNLKLADNAALILPSHGRLDRARDARRGERKIGTTGRGIGPAYEDKVGRRAVRVCDLAEPAALEDRVDDLLVH